MIHPSMFRARAPRRPIAWFCALLGLGLLPMTTRAFSVVPPTFTELVHESGRIVQAQATAVESYRTVSPTGHPLIMTRVTWTVINVLKGATNETLTLEFLGGKVGDEEMRVSGMPRFRVGDHDFLFVEPNEQVVCPLLAAGHGRYPIVVNAVSGRTEVRRSNGRALTQMAQVQDSLEPPAGGEDAMVPLTAEEFAAAVRSVLGNDSKRE